MIIGIEGVDMVGKTAIARLLNDTLPLSTLVKLSGAPKHVDNEMWMRQTYYSLLPFLIEQGSKDYLILDRTYYSELIYAPIFKGYAPTYIDAFANALHLETECCYIYLSANLNTLMQRRIEKCRNQPNEVHPERDRVAEVLSRYDEWYKEMRFSAPHRYHKIEVDDLSLPELKERILVLLGFNANLQDNTYS